jgi:tetratricopeptide (TPR) repeat protein
MGRIEKTVFISYRRTNAPWALAVFQYLTQHGYDVFFDYNGIASGDFERVILENIAARAHFLLLLTPSALEGCNEPNDWLRREIEAAISTHRNIVPLMLEGFSFSSPAIAPQLTGSLEQLHRYNALPIPVGYFLEAMSRLSDRFLSVPLEAVLHPVSPSVNLVAADQKSAAIAADAVTRQELTAQGLFERGVSASAQEEKVRLFSEAIRLDPMLASAYTLRAHARSLLGDLTGAMQDCAEALRLKPDYAAAIMNRGLIRLKLNDLDGAMQDCEEAIRLKPDQALSFNSRGIIRTYKKDLAGAIEDYTQAIHLDRKLAIAYKNRALARGQAGDIDGAMTDVDAAIRLKPDDAQAFHFRGWIRARDKDFAGAIDDYTVALRLDPKIEQVTLSRASANFAAGRLGSGLVDSLVALAARLKTNTPRKP